ncbi:hypothetical protein Q604_UNBC14787G0001, partial [human gut metagenome]
SSEVQFGQRVAFIDISLQQQGHTFVLCSYVTATSECFPKVASLFLTTYYLLNNGMQFDIFYFSLDLFPLM